MRKLLFSIAFLLSTVCVFGQKTLGPELNLFGSDEYRISVKEEGEDYLFEIKQKGGSVDGLEDFRIPKVQFDLESFKELLIENYNEAIAGDDSREAIRPSDSEISTSVFELFWRIQGVISVSNNLEDEPVAGILHYWHEVPVRRFHSDTIKVLKRRINKALRPKRRRKGKLWRLESKAYKEFFYNEKVKIDKEEENFVYFLTNESDKKYTLLPNAYYRLRRAQVRDKLIEEKLRITNYFNQIGLDTAVNNFKQNLQLFSNALHLKSSLSKSIERLKRARIKLENQIDELADRIDSVSNKINDLRMVRVDSSQSISQLDSVRVSWTDRLEQMEIELIDLHDRVKISTNSLLTVEEEINERKRVELTPGLDRINRYQNELTELAVQIDKIEIEFNEGYIENLQVVGQNKNFPLSKSEEKILKELDISAEISRTKRIQFDNQSPLGFSVKRNYIKLKGANIYNFGPYTGGSPRIKLSVNDLLQYEQKHKVNRKDFSPANQIITITPKNQSGSIQVKKIDKRKLFELKVFTDFAGFNETEPNGLVQTEVEKRINLSTRRFYADKAYHRAFNYGFTQFITPILNFSKIESDDRRLELGNSEGQLFASTTDLRQYQFLRLGYTSNVFLIEVPDLKTTWLLDAGIYFGRTAVVDSTNIAPTVVQSGNVQFGVNTLEIMVSQVSAVYKPSESFNFSLNYSHSFYWLLSNEFTQVANSRLFQENNINPEKDNNQINTVGLELSFNPNRNEDGKPIETSGRFFFRYRYTWQHSFIRTGFQQVQLGYSIPLFSRIKL